ncbi:GGDEF domain-containing protein [Algirhabdus cladophorae]|uniref:GGDEF domain-containing protein n=1 Tax=Algirhabdus cladophorae TaxID=3377108 RepID=UPI003B845142
MKIRSLSDVWLFAIGTTICLMAVVGALIMWIYPREDWWWEIPLSMSITGILTLPTCVMVARSQLHIFKLNMELQAIVDRDRLTDVATRDYFFDRMKAEPHAYGVSLMVDIDHFKSVNDTYGHYAGDAVIQHVARLIKAQTQPQDIVCRFGGEEFVIFLHQADLSEGNSIAEKIRTDIEANPAMSDGAQISVTVSIGGSLKEAAQSVDASIKLADTALYRAKETGRNKIVFPLDMVRADRKKA